MENILLGLKKITLGIVTALTATSHGVSVLPQATPTPQVTPAAIDKNIVTRSGEYSYSGHTLKYTIRVFLSIINILIRIYQDFFN